MGKPSQASEDQLNVWVASLSRDILATNGTTGSKQGKKVEHERRTAGRKSLNNPQKRSTEDVIQNNGESKRQRKRGRNDLGGVGRPDAYQEEADSCVVRLATDERRRAEQEELYHDPATSTETNAETLAELRTLEMKLKTILDQTTSKKKAYRVPYDPRKGQSAASVSKRKLNLQPRRSDYGGIGLARDSFYIALDEKGWRKKLCNKFIEHVPGFFGKQRTKAMKKQTSGDMLWRQRLAMKQQRDRQSNEDGE